MDMMSNTLLRPDKRINTIGDLIDWLSTFDRNWSISVMSRDGVARYDTHIDMSSVSTVLTSDGEEVEW